MPSPLPSSEFLPALRRVLPAMPDVFPWVSHLSADEIREFTLELVAALSDRPYADDSVRRVVAGWQATTRIQGR